MAGIKAARKIQLGKETTAGSEANATTVWRGTGSIQDNLTTVFPTENIGILTGTDRSYIPRVEASLTLDQTEATFEQLPYLFECGIRHVTPTTDADSEGVYTYTIPTASSSDVLATTDLQTFTVEAGDNQQEEQFLYGFARSISLSGSAGEALMCSAEIIGRQVATGTFTASVAIPTVEDILFSKGVLYIDAVASSTDYPAVTQVSNTLISMDVSINTGWTPVYTADGQVYFSFIKPIGAEVTAAFTFEHNTSSVAEIAAWRAGTARSISVEFNGTTGKTFRINMVGKWDNFEKLGERDGNDIVTGTFRARYNSTAVGMAQFIVQNANASLT